MYGKEAQEWEEAPVRHAKLKEESDRQISLGAGVGRLRSKMQELGDGKERYASREGDTQLAIRRGVPRITKGGENKSGILEEENLDGGILDLVQDATGPEIRIDGEGENRNVSSEGRRLAKRRIRTLVGVPLLVNKHMLRRRRK